MVGSLLIYEWAATLSIRRASEALDQITEIIGSLPDMATVVDGTTGKDYLNGNFLKRDVISKKNWESVGYLWKRSPDVLSDFAIEIGCSIDRFKLFEIHIDQAAVADLKGTFQRILQFVSDELQPIYGIGLSMPYFWGPRAFAHGSSSSRFATADKTLHGPPAQMKEQSLAFGRTFRADRDKRHLNENLRDVFPFNLLSQGHLDRRLDGKRLEHWIEENAYGALRQLSPVTWQWDVPPEDVQKIRKLLIDAGLTISKE
ncbi:hypothetical protein [Mesorhizobium helmanticense]|uniref:hypothetical protein n=1 Tax=Mesorhizobium helmanticense TaxID=1776423 RepID=UPI0011B28D2B|nr:hypothetical protein [Mesorhizobium helmanticense]